MEGCATLQMPLTKHKLHLLFFFGIIVLFSLVNLLVTNTTFAFTDTIYDGIMIGNVPVGGLSVDEAEKKLLNAFQNQTNNSTITVRYENDSWSINPQDIELTVDAKDLALQAHHIGRTGNIITLIQERYLAVHGGYTIPFIQQYNQDKLSAFLATVAKSVDQKPQNASLLYANKAIQIIPEVWGRKLDIPVSIANFTTALNNGTLSDIELTVNKESPTIFPKEFADIDSLVAVYTTEFDPNNKNRYQNIAIAAQKISNLLLHSGEIFSFNEIVGLRLQEYGYKEAPAFIDGKLLLDWGGGVCQVSTTLYNTVLLADMEIEERTSHFQPPSYVPLGQDAAVADNLLDFKFKNTSPYNIYITSELSNNQITVYLFGKKNPNAPEIRIETTSKRVGYNTIIKQDNSLPRGKEVVESAGQKGFDVKTYRVKSVNGKEISREHLSSDEFPPENRIIRIGTQGKQSAK